jgi:hypothetical protein
VEKWKSGKVEKWKSKLKVIQVEVESIQVEDGTRPAAFAADRGRPGEG